MNLSVEIRDAMRTLPELLSKIKGDDQIILQKGKLPVAKILPIESKCASRKPGSGKGKYHIHDDFDVLPQDFMKYFNK